MSFAEAMRDGVSVEECLDELGEALRAFAHVPPTLLAVALRVHLEALLQALIESRVCTRAEVRAFVKELERESLEYGED
jgi:hypothetical protein